jgi:hypothetical protein
VANADGRPDTPASAAEAGAPPDGRAGADDGGLVDAPATATGCGGGATGPEGWIEIEASTGGSSGPMTSPVVRCVVAGDRFEVAAAGIERDGVDGTMMRISIERGFHGAGTYQGGPGQGIRADVFHDDVGGFGAGTGSSCTVCVEAGGLSGTFTCNALAAWSAGSTTLDVRSGTFRCGPDSAPAADAAALGAACRSTFYCSSGVCAEPSAACRSGACASRGRSFCVDDCSSTPCAGGYECVAAKGIPGKVCLGVCGNGTIEAGEVCDLPARTNLCDPVCTGCLTLDRGPGWLKMDGTIAATSIAIDAESGDKPAACASQYVTSMSGYAQVRAATCEAGLPTKYLYFPVPLQTGIRQLDGTPGASDLCVQLRSPSDDLAVYCAFVARVPPRPGESGSIEVSEVMCGGRGARGTVRGHLLYVSTMRRSGGDVVEPARVGQFVDVNSTFTAIPPVK